MRRRANPYRVLAHALDVGDMHLVELLLARLSGNGGAVAVEAAPAISRPAPRTRAPAPGAEAAVERLLALLALTRSAD